MHDANGNLIVGAFVAVGATAIVALSIIFAGGRSNALTVPYSVIFDQEINGLTLGAPVRYLGVEVGEVVNIDLTMDLDTRVRVDIDLLESTPVTTATYASLAFQGVTGVAFISLAADHAPERMPLARSEAQRPVIPARSVGLAALLSDGPEITHKISRLLDRATIMLDEDNEAAISSTLANIDRISSALASRDVAVEAIPANMLELLSLAKDTVSDFQSIVNQSEPGIASTLQSLESTSTHLQSATARLDAWLAANDLALSRLVDNGLSQTPELIAELRGTLRAIEKLIADLREDPSILIHQPKETAIVADP